MKNPMDALSSRGWRSPWRYVALSLAAGAIALGGFACTSRSVSGSFKPASNQSSAQSKDVLANAVDQSSQADTVQFKVNMSLSGGMTGSQDVTGSGSADFTNKEAAMTLQVLGTDVDVVAAQDTVYLKTAVLGPDWYKLDASLATRAGGSQLFAAAFIDPQKQFELLKEASTNVQSLGSEQIDGQNTTHYRATVDITKGATDSGMPQSDVNELQSLGITTIPTDVWVNGNGQIVRIGLNYTAKLNSGSEQVQATVDYSGYGQPVNVSVPPASQVRDFRDSGIGNFFGHNGSGGSSGSSSSGS